MYQITVILTVQRRFKEDSVDTAADDDNCCGYDMSEMDAWSKEKLEPVDEY